MRFVLRMWDVYTNCHMIKLPRFWQEAFKVAYEELIGDVVKVRDIAINKIAKMSFRSIHFDPPLIQSMGMRHEDGIEKNECFNLVPKQPS
ncbi:hypothetical protein E2542_SST00946 [Spatholobus suberectus]|nr:hypothetical protein E2542_SST00946 [Spatholobus suberectus]